VSYTTQAALAEYLTSDGLIQLTDDAGTGSADATKVTAAIEGAEDEVNGMLAGLYTVPLTGTVPGVVEEITRQLATLRLHQRRLPVPEDVWAMAREARRQLGLIAAGTLKLYGDDIAENSTTAASFSYDTRVFSRTKFAGW